MEDLADVATDKDLGLPLTRAEIEAGDIRDMAKDKINSRLLQRSIVRGGPEIAALVFQKAEPFFMELVRDQFGNYLSQKMLEVASAEQFNNFFELLKNELASLAQDVHGTRVVQKVVEQATGRGKVSELVEMLPAELVETLARSVTGFHVAVKMIELLPARDAAPFFEKLCGTREQSLSIGSNQWGCCVLKKCIDKSEDALHRKIVTLITDNTLELVRDPFGNYAIQHLIISGDAHTNSHITRIIDALKGKIFELSMLKFSSNVLEKCLVNSTETDRNKIINEVLNPPGHLPSEAVRMLLFHQYGNYVFQQSLEVAKDPQFSLLVEHSKRLIQEVVMNVSHGKQDSGCLSAEHARRLAIKLVKKYPAFSEGLGVDTDGSGMDCAWGSGFYNPYGYPYGVETFGHWPSYHAQAFAYGYPPALGWENFGGFQQTGQTVKGRKGGKGNSVGKGAKGFYGQQRGKDKSKGHDGMTAAAGTGDSQVGCVGRIVGFWPNYTITYDEVPPTPADGGSGRGGRCKNVKAKGKGKKSGGAVQERNDAKEDEVQQDSVAA
eukprot:TRINITY_DN43883_c0_g1_i1.p1 TRINITY_DN43883_c0_g1~~TRINITY_DN43883_c0_g1_i1.p1  ORF type:complete len:583 (-),score=110.96 TRINITY_DN43883_c0_g1_i1:359-2008(-)